MNWILSQNNCIFIPRKENIHKELLKDLSKSNIIIMERKLMGGMRVQTIEINIKQWLMNKLNIEMIRELKELRIMLINYSSQIKDQNLMNRLQSNRKYQVHLYLQRKKRFNSMLSSYLNKNKEILLRLIICWEKAKSLLSWHLLKK